MEVGTVPAEEALQEMGEDEGEVRGAHISITHTYTRIWKDTQI